jgi:hypothetical protein
MTIEKEPAPPGYRFIVRSSLTHAILGIWNERAYATEQVKNWNNANLPSQAYLQDLEKHT